MKLKKGLLIVLALALALSLAACGKKEEVAEQEEEEVIYNSYDHELVNEGSEDPIYFTLTWPNYTFVLEPCDGSWDLEYNEELFTVEGPTYADGTCTYVLNTGEEFSGEELVFRNRDRLIQTTVTLSDAAGQITVDDVWEGYYTMPTERTYDMAFKKAGIYNEFPEDYTVLTFENFSYADEGHQTTMTGYDWAEATFLADGIYYTFTGGTDEWTKSFEDYKAECLAEMEENAAYLEEGDPKPVFREFSVRGTAAFSITESGYTTMAWSENDEYQRTVEAEAVLTDEQIEDMIHSIMH